jgi:hypothetical protein
MSELPIPSQQQENEEIIAGAENYFAWYTAYQGAGFSEQQAFMLVCRPMVILNNNIESGPEMAQAMSKMSMLFDRQLAEEEE